MAAPGAYVDIYYLTPADEPAGARRRRRQLGAVFALPAGEYSVTAHVPGEGIASAHVTVPGATSLQPSGTGSLAGRVEGVDDGETFQPQVAGCFSDGGSVVVPPSQAGAGRRRALPRRRPARVHGDRVRADREADAAGPGRGARARPRADLDLAPPRPKTVRVSVVDDHDAAVAGAQVMVIHMDADAQGQASPDPVATDSRGIATVEAHVGDMINVFHADNAADLPRGWIGDGR